MKISWGTSLVLAIFSFIAFIMFFVITMITDKAYSHDLVVEEYYKNELTFQEQLDKTKNASLLSENIQLEQTSEGLVINFPQELEFASIKGNVFLYRPSNKQLDSEIPLSLSSHQLLVPDSRFIDGRWNIIIDWEYKGEKFYFKEDILY
ncbi:FixH family protein [Salinimicrobium sp. MT39]|uniref:FixH family protein n=1 Tax=Salinimicrobium profundisediminis TaxID=2994553 RepID=A0A9X3CU72_9FLAO|nr:FixH family protein [Salinimicrobium profundisediminis]MCX2836774.1 FixH family protein [Salinimicrobium profundisediminis]